MGVRVWVNIQMPEEPFTTSIAMWIEETDVTRERFIEEVVERLTDIRADVERIEVRAIWFKEKIGSPLTNAVQLPQPAFYRNPQGLG